MELDKIKKMYAFDIDNTIAECSAGYAGKISEKNIKLMKKLQNNESIICLVTGNSAAYASGMARQSGLENIMIIGESGFDIQFTHIYPPIKHVTLQIDDDSFARINSFRQYLFNSIRSRNKNIWSQATRINITMFFDNDKDKNLVLECIDEALNNKEYEDMRQEFILYKHHNSVELVKKNIDKGKGIEMVRKKMLKNIKKVISFGDSYNDIPMFKVSDYNVCIGENQDIIKHADIHFDKIEDALEHLLKLEGLN